MTSILIRNLKAETKTLLQRRARRKGKSLESDLRDVLERLAKSEADTPDDTAPFGTWLVAASRPGVDLTQPLKRLRAGKARIPDFR